MGPAGDAADRNIPGGDQMTAPVWCHVCKNGAMDSDAAIVNHRLECGERLYEYPPKGLFCWKCDKPVNQSDAAKCILQDHDVTELGKDTKPAPSSREYIIKQGKRTVIVHDTKDNELFRTDLTDASIFNPVRSYHYDQDAKIYFMIRMGNAFQLTLDEVQTAASGLRLDKLTELGRRLILETEP